MPLLDLSGPISDLIPKKDVLYRPVGDQDERYLDNSPLSSEPKFLLTISRFFLILFTNRAGVVKLVDAEDSKSSGP